MSINEKEDIVLSKKLSWLTRHGALKERLSFSKDGYIPVDEILNHRSIFGRFKFDDIRRVVQKNDKQRFTLRTNPSTKILEIKAHQGHTIPVCEKQLTPIEPNGKVVVVHGTYLRNWPSIKQQGLCRMLRQHIHFAEGNPKHSNIIRKDAQIFIYINLEAVLKDGIKFYRSENGVILTPGDEKGLIATKYFARVTRADTGPAQASRPLAAVSAGSPRRPAPVHPQPKPRPFSAIDHRPNHSNAPQHPSTSSPRPSTANSPQHKPTTDNPQRNATAANISQQNASSANSPSPKHNKSAANAPQRKAEAKSNSPRHKVANSGQHNESPTQGAAEEAKETPDPRNKIHISGFPPYTQTQDVVQIFTRFGTVRVDKINARMSFAVLQYATEEEAKEAVQQTNKKVAIYGEFLYVRPYTAMKTKQQTPKRDFTKSKERGEIIDPQKIDLSGEFHEQMERILSSVRLTQDEATTISTLYTDLERVLQSQWPGCVAMPFGSITTGLGIKSSDADCYMHVPAPFRRAAGAPAMLINRARRVLLTYPTLFTEILAIPRANTPIVKFFHLPTSTNCDLSFKTPLGAQNSRLIAFLLHSDPRLLPLAVLIKYWAKVHGLSGTGKLTNYALTMMIIFYLQQPPVSILPPVESLQKDPKNDVIVDHWNTGFNQNRDFIPPCTNTSSIPELLGGFFEYYSNFDFDEMVICPYLGKTLEKKLFHDINKLPNSFYRYTTNVVNGHVPPLRVSTPFVVQDPFEQCHNVASPISVKLAMDIRVFLKFAANAYEKEKATGCRDLFKTILLHKPKINKTRSHPEVKINTFPKLVQSIDDPDWKGVIRKIVMIMFQTMLKIKLEKVDDKVNPDTLREKERYKGVVPKQIWKRKQFTKLYTMMNLEFVEKQTKITEEVLNVEKEIIDLHIMVTFFFTNEPQTAAVSIRLMKGDPAHFGELGRFFIMNMQGWFTALVKPYSKPFLEPVVKLADTIKMIDNNTLDSDDDDSTTENVDTNTAESESEKDDMDQDPSNKVTADEIRDASRDSLPGKSVTDTH